MFTGPDKGRDHRLANIGRRGDDCKFYLTVVDDIAEVSSPAAVVMTNWRADQTASDHPSGSS
jgi:hypothetical protein